MKMDSTSWPSPANLLSPSAKSFVLNEETASKIEEICKPFIVVCISGPLRQGKSSLLNRLVKYIISSQDTNGFQVTSTRSAGTKGFWAWFIDHPENPDIGILIIDVEGIGDTCNKSYDNCLLCLSILLSSVFVYNVSSETINRELIDKLHFVKICEHIQQQMNESSNCDQEIIDDPFPVLIIVLRNVSLDSEGASNEYYLDQRLRELCMNRSEDSQNFTDSASGSEIELDTFLKPEETDEFDDKCRMKIKKLTDYFMRRKLFMLPIPVKGDDSPSQTHNLQDDRLKQEFVREVRNLCNFICSSAPVKMLHQKPITGQIFMDLLRKYLQHLDVSGCIFRFKYEANDIIERENELVLQKSVDLYKDNMKSSMNCPVGIEKFNALHLEAHEKALKYFLKNVYLDGKAELHKKLKMLIDENCSSFVKENQKLSSEVCKTKLNDLSALTFTRLANRTVYFCKGGYEKLENEVEEIRQRYDAIPDKGVMADAEWHAFMAGEMELHLKYVRDFDSLLTNSDKERAEIEVHRERKKRETHLQEQSEQFNRSCQQMLTREEHNQFALVEDAYERRINETDNYYTGRISELREEQMLLRDLGRFREAELIDEEITTIQVRQSDSVRKMREVIRTIKEWLHLAKPVLEFAFLLFSLYRGRPPIGRPFVV